MADDLKPMLAKLLRTGGEKRFHFVYGLGKRKDKSDGELVIRPKKLVHTEADKELVAPAHEYYEGICWTGNGPANAHTVYFKAIGKQLSMALVAKMALTAKHIAARQYDFQLPSSQEAARGETLAEHVNDDDLAPPEAEDDGNVAPVPQDVQTVAPPSQAPARQPPDGKALFEARLKSLLPRVVEAQKGNHDIGHAAKVLIDEAEAFAHNHDFFNASAQLDRVERLLQQPTPQAPAPSRAELVQGLESLKHSLEKALAAKGPDAPRIKALAVAFNGLLNHGDHAQAAKVLDELAELLDRAPLPGPAPDLSDRLDAVAERMRQNPALSHLELEFREAEDLVEANDERAPILVQNLERKIVKAMTPPGPAPTDTSNAPPSALFEEFNELRDAVSEELVRLTAFLPEKLVAELNGKYDAAVRQARSIDDAATGEALQGLRALQEQLQSQAGRFARLETLGLRIRITKRLKDWAGLLEPAKRDAFNERLEQLEDKNSPDPEAQLEGLRVLDKELSQAIAEQEKKINDFIVDRKMTEPFVTRAMALCAGKPDKKTDLDELQRLRKMIDRGTDAADQPLDLEKLRDLLGKLSERASNILKDYTTSDFVKQQEESMPVPADSLTVGEELGKGHYSKVHSLNAQPGAAPVGAPSLVGKPFDASNRNQLASMQNEAEVYAFVGEHPNIAKCYGIQQIGDQQMLVMEEVKGNDLNKVFKGLEKKLRAGEIGRAEYLAGIQHLLKGTLQGLAHFEACHMVHSDIKGDNIRFNAETQQPMLIDMGLAVDEGEKRSIGFIPNFPPEAHLDREDNPWATYEVTTAWDSFAVGKLLFPLLERMPDSPQKYQFVNGLGKARRAKMLEEGAYAPIKLSASDLQKGSRAVLEKNADGSFTAKTDGEGNLVDPTLRKAERDGQVRPGEYHAMTNYVDFMNKLTHPDPKQRMSPKDALKEPFMTQPLTDDLDLTTLFGPKPSDLPPPQPQAVQGADDDPFDDTATPGVTPFAYAGEQPESDLGAPELNPFGYAGESGEQSTFPEGELDSSQRMDSPQQLNPNRSTESPQQRKEATYAGDREKGGE
jgi:serine/threonine protein kinase